MNKLKVIATIIAKSEFREDVLKALKAATDGTRTEEGNISYILHEDVKNSLKFIFIEEWKSQEALSLHHDTPHYIALKKNLAGNIESLTADVIREIY